MTITVPDDIAQWLREAAAAQGQDVNAFAVAALSELAYSEDEEGEPDPELIAALRQGLVDRDDGNLRTLEQVDAAVEAALVARFGPAARVVKAP